MSHNVLRLGEPECAESLDATAVIEMIESITYDDLRSYLVDQIIAAENADDLAAAVNLVAVVMAKRSA